MKQLLGRIYHEHRRGLFILALSITRSPADAEDAIHDAFARMCRVRETRPTDWVAYAFAAVRNAAMDSIRRKRPSEICDLSLASCLNGTYQDIGEQERDQAIAAAADELPESLRVVLLLRIYGELNFRQIGELTATPLQTVVSRYEAALERLRPKLRKWL